MAWIATRHSVEISSHNFAEVSTERVVQNVESFICNGTLETNYSTPELQDWMLGNSHDPNYRRMFDAGRTRCPIAIEVPNAKSELNVFPNLSGTDRPFIVINFARDFRSFYHLGAMHSRTRRWVLLSHKLSHDHVTPNEITTRNKMQKIIILKEYFLYLIEFSFLP